MASAPASPIPGMSLEYYNDYNGYIVFRVITAFLILTTLATLTRFVARLYIKKTALGWDDVWIVLGWISLIGSFADCYLALTFGVGYHIERIIFESPELINKWGYACLYAFPMLWCFAVTFPKLSILALYLRIFTDKLSRYTCWGVAIITVMNGIGNFFSLLFQCTPREKVWEATLPGTCTNVFYHLAFAGLANAVTDLIMLVLPIPVLRRLQVPTREKIGLGGIFSLGSVGLVASIIRMVEFLEVRFSSDGTRSSTTLISWALVEMSIYQLSACLLACRPVLTALAHSKPITSLSSWLGRSTIKGSSRGGKGELGDHIPLSDKSDLATVSMRGKAVRDHREFGGTANSTEAFVGTSINDGTTDEIFGPRPGQIHVRRDFDVTHTSA